MNQHEFWRTAICRDQPEVTQRGNFDRRSLYCQFPRLQLSLDEVA